MTRSATFAASWWAEYVNSTSRWRSAALDYPGIGRHSSPTVDPATLSQFSDVLESLVTSELGHASKVELSTGTFGRPIGVLYDAALSAGIPKEIFVADVSTSVTPLTFCGPMETTYDARVYRRPDRRGDTTARRTAWIWAGVIADAVNRRREGGRSYQLRTSESYEQLACEIEREIRRVASLRTTKRDNGSSVDIIWNGPMPDILRRAAQRTPACDELAYELSMYRCWTITTSTEVWVTMPVVVNDAVLFAQNRDQRTLMQGPLIWNQPTLPSINVQAPIPQPALSELSKVLA